MHSGLMVDGIAIPRAVEAEGGAAIEQYVAAQRTADTTPDPLSAPEAVAEPAPSPSPATRRKTKGAR